MDKQTARKILVSVGYQLKDYGYSAEDYEVILTNKTQFLEYEELFEAYELIKDEFIHVQNWVWTFRK